MKTALPQIAWKGLTGRRRDTGMMLCVLTAAFALIAAILCYDSSGALVMEETRKSIYGEWQIARYSMSETQAAEFVEETSPAEIGRAEQYAFLVNEQGLPFGALGTADEEYFACGRLELLSGRLPQSGDEIAMTTSVLDSIGASYELGQTVTFEAANGVGDPVSLCYTLCGVLPSYDAYWAVDGNLPVDAILSGDEGLPLDWGYTVQLLCCYEKNVPLVPYQDGVQDPTWVKNTYAYPEDAASLVGLAVFVAGSTFLTLCAVYGLCSIQLRRREEGLVTLRMIGAGREMVFRICLWEAFFLLSVSLPLGAVVGLLLCFTGLAVQGQSAYLTIPILSLSGALALGALVVLIGMLLPAARQAGEKQIHLPQKKVKLQRKIRLLSPLPLRVVVLNAAGLMLALCCVFLATWEMLPYQRQAETAAVNILSGREPLTVGFVQDLHRLSDVEQTAARTDMPFQSGLTGKAFAQQDYWTLYMNQPSGVSSFRMWDESTIETRVYALPEQDLRELAGACFNEVEIEYLLSGESVLLYTQTFVLDKSGMTQWNEKTTDFTGEKMTLRYPALNGDEVAKEVTIGGCFSTVPEDFLSTNGMLMTAYSIFCSEALGRQLWADEVGTPYGYTSVNVRLTENAAYATQKSIASLVAKRGGVLHSNGYETANRLWQEGSASAFLSAAAGILSVTLAIFLLWNLFQIYWQNQRGRIGLFQAEGAARRMFWRSGLRQGAAAALGALLLGNGAVALLWLFTTTRLVTEQRGGIYVLSSLPMRSTEYPWVLHLAVCAGYLLMVLGLQIWPLARLVRQSPIQNLKEGV